MGRQLQTVLVVVVALALVPGCIAAACSVPELLGLQEAGESGRVPYVLGIMGTNPKCAQCLIKCQSAVDKVACAKDCAVRVPSQNALCHRSRCTVGCPSSTTLSSPFIAKNATQHQRTRRARRPTSMPRCLSDGRRCAGGGGSSRSQLRSGGIVLPASQSMQRHVRRL